MASSKRRVDQVLVERGLVESREKAQALVLAGDVLVEGRRIAKAGTAIEPESAIEILARPRYVSRGGQKLQAALDHFGVSVDGRICVDVGASTGGFTDCLLQYGALRVYAVDVGNGQLDWKLRNDPRVIVRERLNARNLRPEDIGEPVTLAVCDVSFISVTQILPAIRGVLADTGEMVILVKPQFEVGRGRVGKGGIVRDPELHREVCQRVSAAVVELGFETALIDSPILGAEGNKEFLLYAKH